MAHKIVFPVEHDGTTVEFIELWPSCSSWGPARLLHTYLSDPHMVRLDLDALVETVVVPAPKQADASQDWLARSHVWYTQLPDRILNPIQRTLLNQEV